MLPLIRPCRPYILAALSLLLCAPAASAAAPDAGEAPPPHHPIVQAVYVHAPPNIDGRLEDECWSRAVRLEGFGCLDVDQPVPEETVALICVDDEAIYLAVICRDRTPGDIVANEIRRNGDIWSDDFVWFCLDPWHQHKEGYFFNVTPRGTQCEQIPGGSAAKIEWRGDWTAAAARTSAGWQAEIAIPFAILRYPADQTAFGFNVGRRFARERISARYPAEMGITADPTRAADLVGLRPPVPSPRPVLMPYLTLDFGESVRRRFDAGLDLQHTLPNGLTALAVLNPDFKQIEDVVEPISFSYTERFLPDPRPFFLTGQQGYLPPTDLLYTRRIQDFDAGIKLFGTLGDDTIGLLDAVTLGDQSALAAAWRRRFSDEMSTKLLLVSHRRHGVADSFCYGLDADYSRRTPDGFDGLWLRLYQSQTDLADPGGSYTIGGGHYRGVGHLRYDWQLQLVTDGFDPTLGYFPDTDYLGGEFNFGKWDRFEAGPIEGRGWFVNTYYYPHLTGGMFRSGLAPSYSWTWRSGRSLELGLSRSRRDGFDSSDASASYAWNTRDMFRSGSIFLLRGSRLDGDYAYYSVGQGFRPTQRIALRADTSCSRLADSPVWNFHTHQTVFTASYDITPEKCIAARGIWRDAGFTAYASYRQVVRRGMDAYVILGDPDPDRTGFTNRLALKLIWTL